MYDGNVNMNCFVPYGVNIPKDIESSQDFHTLNWSGIQSKLIQLAGRLCNYFASDVVISINSIQRKIDNKELQDGDYFMFGFREMGVDHNAYIENQTESDVNRRYREIWKLDVKIGELDDGYSSGIQFSLYRVEYNEYANHEE